MQYDQKIGGRITVPTTPGHGASFDESQLDNKITVAE
jgi:hypothetical protein